MSNDPLKFKTLFEKYTKGTASPKEIEQLFQIIAQGEHEHEMKSVLHAELEATQLQDNYDNERWKNVFNRIKTENRIRDNKQIRQKSNLIKKISIAASIAIGLCIGFYFYRQNISPDIDSQIVKNNIVPGKDAATLTLSNGRKIILSDANKGILAKEAGVRITKTTTGKIIYEVQDNKQAEIKSNTLATARGETYQIRLPDGTDVWLNAASSLKYPASFAAKSQRRVELTGEAYFEVAKDKAHPFIVKTDKQEVQVLGTHFNINSYADEPFIKTTLLEGSVKISANGTIKLLAPGEQAVLNMNALDIKPADIEETMAWRNGYFRFHGEKIESVMRKIGRWYNVDVAYEGEMSKQGFNGKISRFKNLNQVLKMLNKTEEVQFKIEGGRLIVKR